MSKILKVLGVLPAIAIGSDHCSDLHAVNFQAFPGGVKSSLVSANYNNSAIYARSNEKHFKGKKIITKWNPQLKQWIADEDQPEGASLLK
jgi:hypothetical protein